MKLKYGRTSIDLPGAIVRDAELIMMKPATLLAHVEDKITAALMEPNYGTGLPGIVEAGDTVGIVVNDITRVARTEIILPQVLRILNRAGVSDEKIFIIFAEGLHRKTTEEEKKDILGADIASRIKTYNHDANDGHKLVKLGTTRRKTPVFINKQILTCDKRIVIGSINYHFFAGFGGGYKALVPGLAGAETIKANHSLMLDRRATLGRLQGNPVHEDLKEAASLIGCDFLINVVLDEHKNILAIFSGGIDRAHSLGCEYVADLYGVTISEPADLVIASCGGYPKDLNVYQAQKTLENAFQAVKPGGAIILAAQCPEGAGSDQYLHWARKYKTLKEIEAALKNNFVIGGHKAYAVLKVTSAVKVHLVTEMESGLAVDLGFVKCASLEEALKKAMGKTASKPRTCILPEGAITTPILIAEG